MAGIYIHIPFCRSRCIYCGFYSTTNLELCQRYVDAACREIVIRNEKFLDEPSGKAEREIRNYDYPIETIYLGGGTPSQLTVPQLRQVFNALYIYNKVSADAEVTIEVNPDDVSVEFAAAIQQLPVNRVSMGAQTFSDERLQFLHRRHTANQVAEAVQRLRDIDIHNISIDLMYGFPGETLSDWEADIDSALSLNVEHLSAYCLTIEKGTELWDWLSHKRDSPHCEMLPDEEVERAMYEMLMDKLEAAGYEHYEISNFAKPGYRSRHNSSYWDGTPYIGIGAAAHSYDGHTRSWNIADIHQYIKGMERGERLFDSEVIDDDTHYNDMVTVALRTREGLALSTLSDSHRAYCLGNARRFIDDGLLRQTTSHLSLTRKGLFVSDMIMSELMKI